MAKKIRRPKEHREFDGHRLVRRNDYPIHGKFNAEQQAKKLREKYRSARIIKTKEGYWLYSGSI